MRHPVFVEADLPKRWRKFRLPPALDNRLRELLDRQDRDGKLTPSERSEAEELVELVDILTLMKARTKQKSL
jgi:hypothetical protein